jgi:hypothetical protein
MSLCIVQSSGKSDLGPVDLPGAALDGTKIESNFAMGVLVTIEVPLSSFSGSAALKVASIRQGVSLDVTAGRQRVSMKSKQCLERQQR